LLQAGHGVARLSVLTPPSLHSSVGAVIDVPFQSADALHNDQRREAISRDISRRLRRVCVNLSAADFLQLVNSMVAMQLRGELRKNHFFGPQ
jgi:hypothetical protein